ncbi:MAG: restriction endonuclease subunit S [Candidatus Sedimenticola sp. (ex Thyasira tokunagai)]
MKNETYQTDIGRIPVGWVPYRVGELVSFSGGSQPDKSTFKFRPSKGYIRLIQIRDYKTDKYETYIPEVLARKTCGEHDVMIGRYGPPIFQILRGIKGAYNVALIKAIPSDKVDAEFFYHFIRNENLYGLMESLSRRSSGQTGVELSALREYPLPLPKKKEQIAIANALSDVDALIASLESLITKKRAIKTAAMQQLLTGKKEL